MRRKYDLIIVAGAPGAGKTSISEVLKDKFQGVHIDSGWLRDYHLNKGWKNANKKEEQMAFENLIFIIKNYLKNGYKNIIIDDLLYDKIVTLEKIFKSKQLVILILTLDDKELKRRISHPTRDSGFRNLKKAKIYARQWEKCKLPRSMTLDITHYSIQESANKIMKMLTP